MRLYEFDTEVVLPLIFHIEGQPLTPDDGTVRYRIESVSSVLQDWLTIPAGEVSVTIPQAANADDGDPLRWVTFEFTVAGVPRRERQVYELGARSALFITREQVIEAVGLSQEEVPSDVIDLQACQRELEGKLGTALLVGNHDLKDENYLVLYYAAMRLAQTAQFRILHSQQLQNERRTRFANADLKAIIPAMEAEYLTYWRRCGGAVTTKELVKVLNRPDAVTGA